MTFHPCGMIMDDSRRCRRSFMRVTHGQPPIRVVWFRVPADRPQFSGRTPWLSRDFATEHFNDGIGEQEEHPRPGGAREIEWYNGAAPAPYTGHDFCGTEHAAHYGGVIGLDPVFRTNRIGQPPCCASPFVFGDDLGVLAQLVGWDAYVPAADVVRGTLGVVTLAGGGDSGPPAEVGTLPLVWGLEWELEAPPAEFGFEFIIRELLGLDAGPPALLGAMGVNVQLTGADYGSGSITGDPMGALAGLTGDDSGPGSVTGTVGALAGLTGEDAGPDGEEGTLGTLAGLDGEDDGPDDEEGTLGTLAGLDGMDTYTPGGGGGGPPCSTSGTYTVVVAGVTSFPDSFGNGSYPLVYTGFGTEWHGGSGLFDCYLELPGSTCTMTFRLFGTIYSTYTCSSFSCATGGTFTLVTDPDGSWPGTLTVTSP